MNRKEALRAGEKWYTPTDPCTKCHTLAERYVANGRCRGCNPISESHSKYTRQPNRKEAIVSGEKWYTPVNPCPKCHTLSDRRVSNGQCSGCHPVTQQHHEPKRGRALKRGFKIYLPEHSCPKCNLKAPTWASNNPCMGCTDQPKALSIMLIAQYPDMIIQRRDADAMGLVYYHNPGQCQHGHKDWRGVKNGECIACCPPSWLP